MIRNYSVFLCLLLLLAAIAPAHAQSPGGQTTISVQGEVQHPLTLGVADLAKMKRVEVAVKDRTGEAHTYSGVSLLDILSQAGATMGKDLRGENMTKYLLVKSGDGYGVVFSLAELDSTFSDKLVFLADQMDGKPLPPGKGPFRIIAPGEKKPARWIWEVRTITVAFAKE
jgi:DMSO/TMAO reductase YedYZ molybdopterin-dependent catalytic subunit